MDHTETIPRRVRMEQIEGQVEDSVEELGFPRKTSERAVTQLQKELDDCRTEFEITRKLTPAPARNADS